jgi:hypothetical protein
MLAPTFSMHHDLLSHTCTLPELASRTALVRALWRGTEKSGNLYEGNGGARGEQMRGVADEVLISI